MSEPAVHAVRGIELAVRDIDTSARFYEEVWGLETVSREGDAVRLRATGREHHVLTLRASPASRLTAIHTKADDQAAVDGLHQRAIAMGMDILDAPSALPGSAGGGYGFAVSGPDGLRITISCDVANHAATIDDRTRPNKFSHIVLRCADREATGRFFTDLLGFKTSDQTDGIHFMRCSRDHHSVALARAEGVGMHHMAFEVPNLDGLMYAAGRVNQKGYPLEWGVGRHSGPGNNIFSFFVEPNGFAAEYTTEMEQVDDATYPQRSAEWWAANRPNGPDAWGLATQRSALLHKARTGQMTAELDLRCEDIITWRLAHAAAA